MIPWILCVQDMKPTLPSRAADGRSDSQRTLGRPFNRSVRRHIMERSPQGGRGNRGIGDRVGMGGGKERGNGKDELAQRRRSMSKSKP